MLPVHGAETICVLARAMLSTTVESVKMALEWAVRLVVADGQFNLPQWFVCMHICFIIPEGTNRNETAGCGADINVDSFSNT